MEDSDSMEGMEVPCIICGKNGDWREVDEEINCLFIKRFGLEAVLKEEKQKAVDGGYGEVGDASFPFCMECKEKIRNLVELVELKKEEMEGKITEGVEELKRKANSSEMMYGWKHIYELNQRYFLVRSRFVTSFYIQNLEVEAEYKTRMLVEAILNHSDPPDCSNTVTNDLSDVQKVDVKVQNPLNVNGKPEKDPKEETDVKRTPRVRKRALVSVPAESSSDDDTSKEEESKRMAQKRKRIAPVTVPSDSRASADLRVQQDGDRMCDADIEDNSQDSDNDGDVVPYKISKTCVKKVPNKGN